MYNRYDLIGLVLRLEPHIPEHVVDQMNNVLVHQVALLLDSSFDRVAERKKIIRQAQTNGKQNRY